jgi:hypothetical protein
MSYAMRGASRAWGLGGEEDCTPGSHWNPDSNQCECGEDSILVNGQCRDRSVMCGPGTQWVEADKACVPITKYMSPAQIAAAVKANVPAVLIATTGSATPRPAAVATRPPATVAAPAKKGLLAGMFSGPNAPWIIGGLAVGALGLAVLSRGRSEQHQRRAY